MIDLSSGGLCMRTPFHVPTEHSASIRFTLPSTSDTIDAQCSVVWASDDRCGLRFLKLPRQSRSALDRWLNERMESVISLPARARTYEREI